MLIARCERLQREVASGSLDLSTRHTCDTGPSSIELLRAAVRDGVTAKERAAGVLDLLLKEAGAASGYLFGCDESELVLLCQRGSEPPPANLRERIRREIESARASDRGASSMATRVLPSARTRAADRLSRDLDGR